MALRWPHVEHNDEGLPHTKATVNGYDHSHDNRRAGITYIAATYELEKRKKKGERGSKSGCWRDRLSYVILLEELRLQQEDWFN